jgi:hypothetical protein
MTTLGVVQEVDVRAFPMEIGKQLLQLGPALNMKRGLVGFNEAELTVKSLLDVLSTYHLTIWPDLEAMFNKYLATVVRFIQLKEYSPLLKESNSRQLLDTIHFFPVTEAYPYEIVLDETELNDGCTQD